MVWTYGDLLARLLLGFQFFYFGWNGFFHWTPLPPSRDEMTRFMQACEETGYLLNFVKVLEILLGGCLLADRFVPLAVLAAVPLVFGIVSLQVILNTGRGWGISILILAPEVILLISRADIFRPLLVP